MRTQDATLAVLVNELKRAHLMESQAVSILSSQARRIRNFAELRQQLKAHVSETQDHMRRLEAILRDLDAPLAGAHPGALNPVDAEAGETTEAAEDNILNDTFATYAYEHFEIATYRSLIDLAVRAGVDGPVPILQQSLMEEENMADWLQDHMGLMTDRYIALCDRGRALGRDPFQKADE